MPKDLATLIAALQEGGVGGSGLLELSVRLRAMARRHLPGNSPLRLRLDSEDLAQEGLLQLVKNVHLFRGTTWAEFLAFVRTILSQKAGQEARRQSVRKGERQSIVDQPAIATSDPTPSVDAMGAEDRRRLKALVDELPSDYRVALSMRLDGLDNHAIAEQLGLSADGVRKRLSRAVYMLKGKW